MYLALYGRLSFVGLLRRYISERHVFLSQRIDLCLVLLKFGLLCLGGITATATANFRFLGSRIQHSGHLLVDLGDFLARPLCLCSEGL